MILADFCQCATRVSFSLSLSHSPFLERNRITARGTAHRTNETDVPPSTRRRGVLLPASSPHPTAAGSGGFAAASRSRICLVAVATAVLPMPFYAVRLKYTALASPLYASRFRGVREEINVPRSARRCLSASARSKARPSPSFPGRFESRTEGNGAIRGDGKVE